MAAAAAPWVGRVASAFRAGFRRAGPRSGGGLRTLGREAEHPVVTAQAAGADAPRFSAFEVGALWGALNRTQAFQVEREPSGLVVGLAGERFSFVAEVGTGTIEIVTEPAQDLHEIAEVYDGAMDLLVSTAREHGALVLGHGMQPLTPLTEELMLQKARYATLHRVIGDPWLSFTGTAADQAHVSIAEDEIVPFTNVTNLLAPVVIALCANSAVYEGAAQPFCSAREVLMSKTYGTPERYGMIDGPHASVEDMVVKYAQQNMLLTPDYQGYGKGNLFQFLEEQTAPEPDFEMEAFLRHEHYIWNSARPRSQHGTLEMRATCQQPWSQRHAAAALNVALVCAAPALAPMLEKFLGPPQEAWPLMEAYYREVVQRGLATEEPASGLIRATLELCGEALQQRGRGEDIYLEPLWLRLEQRRNPAQDAKRAFEDAGLVGVVQHTVCG